MDFIILGTIFYFNGWKTMGLVLAGVGALVEALGVLKEIYE